MEIVFLTAFYLICSYLLPGFPGGSDGKESICNAGDPGSTPFFFFFYLLPVLFISPYGFTLLSRVLLLKFETPFSVFL